MPGIRGVLRLVSLTPDLVFSHFVDRMLCGNPSRTISLDCLRELACAVEFGALREMPLCRAKLESVTARILCLKDRDLRQPCVNLDECPNHVGDRGIGALDFLEIL